MVILIFLTVLLVSTTSPSASISQNFSSSQFALQGQWHLLHESIGISAMHMQLLRNNKVVIFDRTDFGPSNLSLPTRHCRVDPNDLALQRDCTAHSLLYDFTTNSYRALTIKTDTWCSSGAVLSDGTLVQTGGYNDGDRVIRTLKPCNGENCDWIENTSSLSQRRWYASNQILPDGRVIIVGGRGQLNYELYNPRNSQHKSSNSIDLDLLRETKDEDENNLYPFLHLLPDGNLFIFANTRSITLDYKNNRVVKEFPPIPGGDPRNYPSSGSSILLPIDENNPPIEAEVMICGGARKNSFDLAKRGSFRPALSTCGRLRVTDQEPSWRTEMMPLPRVMGDMLLLPNGDVIIVNGAASGTAGWENARNPVLRPIIYGHEGELRNRFFVMAVSERPRLYHSTAILLPDGRVLVGGSNPHVYYNFTRVEYPTDLSLESFSPPYLSPDFDYVRPRILRLDDGAAKNIVRYNSSFSLKFTVRRFVEHSVVFVRIIAPSFTTHSFSMNQRMVVLKGAKKTWRVGLNRYKVEVFGPSKPEIAPPGYYLLFVVHGGCPSSGVWIKVQ